ncbi:hypothetical protein, partial [Marinobacter sp.]|uniref:hypothetical protein n=1 Tax=Marinobacter sp. TaxID=50741 RepID=UPI000C91715B
MAEGIMGLMDSMPDTGPPADARDTSSPNFGKGLSTMEVYEILEPLARMVAERTGDPVQVILQEMVTDPDSIARAKLMLGMDPTTPFPNNIREPMSDDSDVMGIPRDLFESLSTEQKVKELFPAPQTQGIPMTVFEKMSPAQQSKILGMGDTFTNIDLPEGRPTMSER